MYQEFISIQLECLPQYVNIIPGALETLAKLRARDIKVGVTTGYNTEMTDIVMNGMKEQGFVPDSVICSGNVPVGRPAPWMIFRSMQELGVFPIESVVKIGDTLPDIESGLNAGVWTIGVAKTGNMMGLSEDEILSLPENDLKDHLEKNYNIMYRAGAHYVIDGVDDSIRAIYEVTRCLSEGCKP
jgi:phosphonoacetaldehyde hydrolase